MKRLAVLAACLIGACIALPDDEDCLTAAPKQKPTLINGRPANPGEWPASVYISSGGGRCSATLVGEKVLLTAAHCMKDGGNVTFVVGPNKYSAKCAHHPSYTKDATADWALCLVNRSITGIPLEGVLTQKGTLKVRQTTLLTGYGCTEKGTGTGGNDGIFRIGEAKVSRLPDANHDTVLGAGAALCFGDSGGAGYLVEGGRRRVFGVNSRGNIRTTSYLASTFTGAFAEFATGWTAANGTRICGLHGDAPGCRGPQSPGPAPEPSPDPCGQKASW
jgi:hypothetical protein